jgi:hypothetical protein
MYHAWILLVANRAAAPPERSRLPCREHERCAPVKLTDWEAIYELLAADIPDPQMRSARVIAMEAVFNQAVTEAFDTGVRFGRASTTLPSRAERARKLGSAKRSVPVPMILPRQP